MHRHTRSCKTKLLGLGALLFSGTAYGVSGCVNDLENAFIDLTQIIDPCTTVFANCAPGSFIANTIEIGSFEAHCFDPTCTLPGQCGNVPLGATQDPCR